MEVIPGFYEEKDENDEEKEENRVQHFVIVEHGMPVGVDYEGNTHKWFDEVCQKAVALNIRRFSRISGVTKPSSTR